MRPAGDFWDTWIVDGARLFEDDGSDPNPFRMWDEEGRKWAENLIADRKAHLGKVQKRRARQAKG
jgi:hypothetical protein